jgi:tRNA threonylcarbamoyladenosine biosynthesis protein TsaB
MVRILHIETATKVCSVGISENGDLIDFIEESSDKYIHAERLTVFIEQIIERNKLKMSEFSAVAVTSGPGSYTGLRIGVSTAKGICYACDIPLISIGALDGLIAQAQKKYPDTNICAMIDARRMEVFSKIVNSESETIKGLSADELDTSSYASFQPFVVCGDGAEKCKAIWDSKQITFDSGIVSSVQGQSSIAYEKFQNNDFEDVAYFEPKYLKDFIAIKSKKKFF